MKQISEAELKAVIEATAKALDLPVRPDNYPIVAAHLKVAYDMAAFLGEFTLPEDAEPAPVYTA